MTKLTAKKGMMKYKIGHGKEDFDYDFMCNIPYDEHTKLSDVLKTIKEDLRDEFQRKTAELEEENRQMKNELNTLRTAFENTLKGVLTR